MKNIIMPIFFPILSFFLICGCATIVSKSSYDVRIDSSPKASHIVIKDDKEHVYYEGETPTVVSLETSYGYFEGINYTIYFSKEGYKPYFVKLKRDLDGWYILGNIAFGGLIGWFIVDPASGAMWTLPTNVNPNFSHRKITILDNNQIPSELRSQLCRIK